MASDSRVTSLIPGNFMCNLRWTNEEGKIEEEEEECKG